MEKQKLTGYRELRSDEIELINQGKALAEEVNKWLVFLETRNSVDQRAVSLAKTNLQQGFMWATRAIAKPTTF